MSGDFSESQGADDPVSACDEAIRPIFPVRYALTETKLFDLARAGGSVNAPSSLASHPDHDARRIRQGWVYIWAEEHPEQTGSEPSHKWLIFRYSGGGADDANSRMIRSDVMQGSPSPYRFTKYEWHGGAEGEWRIDDPRTYPYAFVHRDVSRIFIAYSEERWPGHLFTLADNDESQRARLMVEVNLTSEETAHSAPLNQLSSKVAEFMPSQEANPLANAVRYTALQPETASRVAICQNSRERGRIVALHDHLGELLDISTLHLAKSNSLKSFSAQYQYPLIIGKGVKNLRDNDALRDANWVRALSYSDQYVALYDSIENQQRRLNLETQNLVDAFYSVATRTGQGTVTTETTITLDGLKEVASDSDMRRVDYAAFMLGRLFLTIGTSAPGSASLMAMFDGTGSTKIKELGDLFNKTIGAAGTASTMHLQRHRTHLNVLFEVTSKELALAMVQSPAGLFYRTNITRILGVRSTSIQVPVDKVGDAMRLNLAQLGFLGIRPTNLTIDGMTATFDVGTRPTAMVGVEFQTVTATGTLNQTGSNAISLYRGFETASNGGTLLLGFFSAYQTVHNWHSVRQRTTSIGIVSHDPVVQVTAAMFDMAASMRGLSLAANGARFSQGVSTQLFSRMFAVGAGTGFFNAASASAQSTSGATGVAAHMGKIITIGNVAGGIGILISMGQSYEGFRSGDRAAFLGNALVAIGGSITLMIGLSLLASGPALILGLVLIVVGIAISFFQHNDAEAWVASSFWGSSPQYWGITRAPQAALIEAAKDMANGNQQLAQAFAGELEGYANLTWSIQVTNAASRDQFFEITFPGFVDSGSTSATQIHVTSLKPAFLGTTYTHPVAIVERRFVGANTLRVKVEPPSESAREENYAARIIVSYPKSSGGEFRAELMERWQEI